MFNLRCKVSHLNGVQTKLKCKPNVKRCKRFVFPVRSHLFQHNSLTTKAITFFQIDHILTHFVFPPLNARIVKMVNRKGRLKCSILVDEVPTLYFKGLDTLIATARSNKVAVCLGAQDFSQLIRDYGDKEARVIQNTIGNIFSGQVVGETAKNLSERFGKVLQQRKSINMTREDTSTNISTQLDSLIPASKISNLSQGEFVGSVCDNFGEKIEQKIFHCEIVVDNERVAAETKAYKPIPVITDFTGADGKDHMQEEIERNYYQIKEDVTQIIEKELLRIQNDPNLKHLLETADDE